MKILGTHPTAVDLNGERMMPKKEGLEQAITVGFGLTYTAREVLEAVGDPWFETVRDAAEGPCDEVQFCERATRAGFPPQVDHALSRECRHVGFYEYALTIKHEPAPV
jgi:hypothetical protein